MRKLLFAGLLALAACDGPDMEVFVGHSEQTLRDALGAPTAVVRVPNGSKILHYRLEQQFAALPASGPLDGTGQGLLVCANNFEIRGGMVVSLNRFGAGCAIDG